MFYRAKATFVPPACERRLFHRPKENTTNHMELRNTQGTICGPYFDCGHENTTNQTTTARDSGMTRATHAFFVALEIPFKLRRTVFIGNRRANG